jgi:hypothetical protein
VSGEHAQQWEVTPIGVTGPPLLTEQDIGIALRAVVHGTTVFQRRWGAERVHHGGGVEPIDQCAPTNRTSPALFSDRRTDRSVLVGGG